MIDGIGLFKSCLRSRTFFKSLYTFGIAILALMALPETSRPQPAQSLETLLQTSDLIFLADVKHGVRDRVSFFSSPALFEAMRRSGVRHVAIEMPRVLGRQAMTIETAADIAPFAHDVVNSERWHFVDPDHPDEESTATQYRVATALGWQVLLAKQMGLDPIFYDFNNPLGDFATYNDPVYRCLTELADVFWLRSGLDGKVTKSQRDAAIMRERLSHDDELAAYIEGAVKADRGGKLVVISGYAHAVMNDGLADRLSSRLNQQAAVVAIFKDGAEESAFPKFLEEQARLLSINLSRPPEYYYTIAGGKMHHEDGNGWHVALDHSGDPHSPEICSQIAHGN